MNYAEVIKFTQYLVLLSSVSMSVVKVTVSSDFSAIAWARR